MGKREEVFDKMIEDQCDHCWHPHEGPYMMVLQDGCVLIQCCKCAAHQQVHRAHVNLKHNLEPLVVKPHKRRFS